MPIHTHTQINLMPCCNNSPSSGYSSHIMYLVLLISAQTELIVPSNSGSVCPGDVLTYICTARGPGNTLWKGSAFHCSSTQNEIILQHSRYDSPGGTTRYCNDRAIVGQSIRVENNDCYISQLNVTISSDMNNKTIECAHTNTTGLNTISVHTLSILSGKNHSTYISSLNFAIPTHINIHILIVPYPPPERVKLANVQLLMEGQLIEFTFNWINLIMNPFYYLITSSNCGICPMNTTENTVTCRNLQFSSDPPPCTISVQSVICEVAGPASNQVEIVPKGKVN